VNRPPDGSTDPPVGTDAYPNGWPLLATGGDPSFGFWEALVLSTQKTADPPAALPSAAPDNPAPFDPAGFTRSVSAAPAAFEPPALAARDVSERIVSDQEQAAAEESFRTARTARTAFDSASHGMARLTPGGRLQRVNDVLCAMVGRSRVELEGSTLRLLTHPDDADPVAELQDRLTAGGTELRRDLRLLRRDGSTTWADLTLTAVRDVGPRVRHLIVQLVDTTAERVLAEQLRGPDLHDALTTAATADLLRERLDTALVDPRHPGVALMRVDLDGFRRLNDARGHDAADRVLVVTVQRLRAAAPENNLVARLGGDDFAMLCVGVDHARVARLAQKVSRALSGSLGGVGPVTASVGVATARPGDGTDDVLNRAEAALSVVKRSGGAGWAVD
jgi:diguanylate cyclase (GGDEF)-like protein/PAS domain S-box-containing protein